MFIVRTDGCWSWNSNILATWCEELTLLKRPWCWEKLRAGGEGDYRGWDGWMASLTQWTWFWVDSGSWWWTGGPGVLRFMGSQRVGHDWATELNWTQFLAHSDHSVKGNFLINFLSTIFVSLYEKWISSVQSLSPIWLCSPMNHSTPGLPVHQQLPEFTQTYVHSVGDAIQPSHPL